MKGNKNELNVDFIGGQVPLTKEEEIAISQFIKSQKQKRESLHLKPKARSAKRQAIINA